MRSQLFLVKTLNFSALCKTELVVCFTVRVHFIYFPLFGNYCDFIVLCLVSEYCFCFMNLVSFLVIVGGISSPVFPLEIGGCAILCLSLNIGFLFVCFMNVVQFSSGLDGGMGSPVFSS